jgi:hypothetical protein
MLHRPASSLSPPVGNCVVSKQSCTLSTNGHLYSAVLLWNLEVGLSSDELIKDIPRPLAFVDGHGSGFPRGETGCRAAPYPNRRVKAAGTNHGPWSLSGVASISIGLRYW